MPQGDHNRIPTVSEAVRDAAAIADPGDSDDAIMALYEIYEDDDRPATAAENLADELIATARGDHVLREGVRAAFGKHAPPQVVAFLESRGVRI
jgi:hypothetical protein